MNRVQKTDNSSERDAMRGLCSGRSAIGPFQFNVRILTSNGWGADVGSYPNSEAIERRG